MKIYSKNTKGKGQTHIGWNRDPNSVKRNEKEDELYKIASVSGRICGR